MAFGFPKVVVEEGDKPLLGDNVGDGGDGVILPTLFVGKRSNAARCLTLNVFVQANLILSNIDMNRLIRLLCPLIIRCIEIAESDLRSSCILFICDSKL